MKPTFGEAASTELGNPPSSPSLPQTTPISLTYITRYPGLWYEDGSVVFVAGQVCFRVYRGMVEKHTRYSFDPPVGLYEDCPVILLKDDDGEDFAQLMKSLHDWSEFLHSPSFDVVASIIRAAAKYEFHGMYKVAVRAITGGYPSNLEDFRKQFLPTGDDDYADEPNFLQIAWSDLAPIGVFHLGRSLGLKQFLPVSLYRCAGELSLSSLLAAASADKTDPYFLTAEELKLCLETREVLAERVKDIVFHTFVSGETSPLCTSHVCTSVMRGMVTAYYKNSVRTDLRVFNDPSSWFPSVGAATDVLCDACMSQKTTFIRKLQSTVWDRLCERVDYHDETRSIFGW